MKKIGILIFVMICSFTLKSAAQSTVSQAQSIFIYNFTRLIEWPNKDGDFVIGVFGSSELASDLEKYTAGKRVGLQKIVVKKYKDVEEIGKCNIIFVAASRTSKAADVVSKVSGGHTLIVGEKRGIIESGAAISFLMIDDKLKFELKSSNASKYGLKVNSKLEAMANK